MSTVVAQPYLTSGNGGRKLVRLSNGILGASVYDSSYGLRLYSSTDNGHWWSERHSINNNQYKDSSLVAYGNKVFMLTNFDDSRTGVEQDGVCLHIFDESFNRTQKFIEQNQSAIGNVSLAIDPTNGHLHACWSSKNSTYPTSFNIRYSKSTDGGVTWSAVTQISTNNTSGADRINPTIVVRNSIPVILYQYSQSTTNFIGSYVFNGTSWTHYQVHNGGSYTQSSPSAVVDKDGVIHVAWMSPDSTTGGYYYIRYSKSTDGGVSWSTQEKVNASTSTIYPTITVDKNNTIAIVSVNTSGHLYLSKKVSSGTFVNSALVVKPMLEYPSSLYDVYFTGQFGDAPPTIYSDTNFKTVEYIGTYTTNQAPTVTLKNSQGNTITQNQTIKHSNKTPFSFRIFANDSDENDTLEYSIWLRNVEYRTWTSIDKGVETEVNIPSEQFLLGNNNIEIKVRDSQGDLVSSLFVVRNLTPESYSQNHVYDLIVGWM